MVDGSSGTPNVIYLDHSATTPLSRHVVAAVMDAMEVFGNPSSQHAPGLEAAELVANAREKVATLLQASTEEIIFTGCGSEANNLAVKGASGVYGQASTHIITSQIEHASVFGTCQHLERLGGHVTYLPVDAGGMVDPDDVRRAIRPDTRLISIMHANNETGVIQPIEEIGAMARAAGVVFHSDASQTAGKLPLNLTSLPVDLLTLTGHKMHGPKGVAALFVRTGIALEPLVHGGGQEAGRRAGTENVLGIVGMGAACEAIPYCEAPRLRSMRDQLLRGLLALGDVRVNGNLQHTLPGTLNVSFRYVKSTAVVAALAMGGVAVSAGSACHEASGRPSHVLQAMAVGPDWIDGAVRFSLGPGTTSAEIAQALVVIDRSVRRLRGMSPLALSG